MITDTTLSPYAEATINQNRAYSEGGLIGGRIDAVRNVMIKHILSIFDDKESFFHEVENFRIAAGESEGEFRGNVYGDGDFYKLLEACVFLGVDISRYAALIARAQEKDGYISTKQIIAARKGQMTRHADQDDFEEYNFGHLFTLAAVAYRVTGDQTLLNVAKKAADYLAARYKRALDAGKAMTAVCPSHYMGLAELYRVTREQKYLDALHDAIALRDFVADGTDDNQDAQKLLTQRKMHGHAVRATYLYAGVADLYLETGDKELLTVLDSCFDNLVNTKMYITGGLGALYTGASPFGDLINSKRVHQAFGYEYQLPNITAYNETCASLGGAFWAERMFSIRPDPAYIDFIERIVYNLAFAAMNTRGDKYFYENMLRRTREVDYFLMWPRERTDTFNCFCCPTNLSRFIAELPQCAFFTSFDTLYTGLYMNCQTHIQLKNGASFDITETTDYPWSGDVSFRISNWNGVPYKLLARVPGFAGGGYKELTGETPSVSFDMTPFLVRSHPKLEENESSACVQRGPVIYCLEAESAEGLYIPSNASFTPERRLIGDEDVVTLKTEVWRMSSTSTRLYERLGKVSLKKDTVELIPYFEWDNEGFKEMRIWLPLRYETE
ncbi:MAG: glycoside hydrolase family 127 protein [Clostridia bacterium]|nr:glycoside hydrolase family 127 protein [Clostridia bacterium]